MSEKSDSYKTKEDIKREKENIIQYLSKTFIENEPRIINKEPFNDWINGYLKNYIYKNNIDYKEEVFATEFNHIIDYLISPKGKKRFDRMTWEVAKEQAKQWQEWLNSRLLLGDDPENVFLHTELPNGWKAYELKSEQALAYEGGVMQHCVGGGSYILGVKRGNTKIISLRDEFDKPHATIEISNNETVRQIQGKNNKQPIEKHIPYIIKFLNKNNYNLIDNDNGYIFKLSGKFYYYSNLEDKALIYEKMLKKPLKGGELYIPRNIGQYITDNICLTGFLDRIKIKNINNHIVDMSELEVDNVLLEKTNAILPKKINRLICYNSLIYLNEKHIFKSIVIQDSIVKSHNNNINIDISEEENIDVTSGLLNKIWGAVSKNNTILNNVFHENLKLNINNEKSTEINNQYLRGNEIIIEKNPNLIVFGNNENFYLKDLEKLRISLDINENFNKQQFYKNIEKYDIKAISINGKNKTEVDNEFLQLIINNNKELTFAAQNVSINGSLNIENIKNKKSTYAFIFSNINELKIENSQLQDLKFTRSNINKLVLNNLKCHKSLDLRAEIKTLETENLKAQKIIGDTNILNNIKEQKQPDLFEETLTLQSKRKKGVKRRV